MTTADATGPRLRLPRVGIDLKKRAVFLLMATLSVWPIAHHLMVTTWDMDPWRFFGFSMYCIPKPVVAVVSVDYGVDPDAPAPELSVEQRRAVNRLVAELRRGRQTLGRLYPWRSTFRDIFALLPEEIGSVRVVLARSYLDPDAIFRARRLEMECHRSGGSLACSRNEQAAEASSLRRRGAAPAARRAAIASAVSLLRWRGTSPPWHRSRPSPGPRSR